MRITVAQDTFQSPHRASNLTKLLSWIREASDLEPPTDVLCFPAGCLGSGSTDLVRGLTHGTCDSFISVLGAQARDVGISFVAGYFECKDECLCESVIWGDADGDIVIRRDRFHPCDRKTDHHTDDDGSLQSVGTMFGRVSVVAGDDLLDHALMDKLGTRGTQLIVAPCAWEDPSVYDKQLFEAASRNQCWIVIANRIGVDCGGMSRCISPAGELHGEIAPADQAGFVSWTLNMEKNDL